MCHCPHLNFLFYLHLDQDLLGALESPRQTLSVWNLFVVVPARICCTVLSFGTTHLQQQMGSLGPGSPSLLRHRTLCHALQSKLLHPWSRSQAHGGGQRMAKVVVVVAVSQIVCLCVATCQIAPSSNIAPQRPSQGHKLDERGTFQS